MKAETFYMDVLHVKDARLAKKLAEITKPVQLHKGELLIREGDMQDHFSFLTDGILRGFFSGVNGKEITDCFGYQCGTPAMACLMDGTPALFSIEALTDCSFLQIETVALFDMMQKETELLWVYNRLLQMSLYNHRMIKVMVCQHTAMESYQWFLQAYPGLIDKVNNKHIASFLGITPVTLSRLRRTLREE